MDVTTRRRMPEEGENLQKRARLALVVLGARSVIQQVFVFVGTIVLARLLTKSDFGVFAIIQFVMLLFRTIGDAGLGASLIQKQDAPSQRDLSTVFWTQLGLTSLVVSLLWLASSYLGLIWSDLPDSAPMLLRALSVSLLFTMMRVIPAILLERQLNFTELSIVDIAGTVSFYSTAISLALFGVGTVALVCAVLVQSGLMLVMTLYYRPWRPSLQFRMGLLQSVLGFGVLYQGKAVVGFINNAVTPVAAGSFLGAVAVGINNFAINTAWFPLQLVAILGRVTFPLFSRLASDREALGREVRFSLRLCGMVTAAFTALFLSLGPEIVRIIYGEKWLAAIGPIYIYASVLLLGFISPVIGTVFDGLGRPGVFFRLSVMWTSINWVAVLLAVTCTDSVIWFAAAFACHVVIGNLAAIWAMREVLPQVNVLRMLAPAYGVSLSVALLGRWFVLPRVDGLFTLLGGITTLLVVFGALLLAIDRDFRGAALELGARIRRRREKSKVKKKTSDKEENDAQVD